MLSTKQLVQAAASCIHWVDSEEGQQLAFVQRGDERLEEDDGIYPFDGKLIPYWELTYQEKELEEIEAFLNWLEQPSMVYSRQNDSQFFALQAICQDNGRFESYEAAKAWEDNYGWHPLQSDMDYNYSAELPMDIAVKRVRDFLHANDDRKVFSVKDFENALGWAIYHGNAWPAVQQFYQDTERFREEYQDGHSTNDRRA